MSKSYQERVELRDGDVVLFKRPDVKRPVWQMRLHVRGMKDLHGKPLPYIQASTGEVDLDEAKHIAQDKHDELKLKVRNKEPAKDVTFADLYQLWWTQKREQLGVVHKAKGRSGVTKRISWYEGHSRRYWLPYFAGKRISDLNQAYIAGYWQWRMGYWRRAADERRKLPGNHAMTPAKKSLDMEQAALREVFRWANAMRITSYQPIIENPYSRKGIAATRRPSFEHDEWLKLQAYMNIWQYGAGKYDERVNASHIYRRRLLRLYIEWLVATGMRPGEALLLRHRDLTLGTLDDGLTPVWRISVPKDTKTGARTVTAMSAALRCQQELKIATKRSGPDDWLFCGKDGRQAKGFAKTLPKLLAEVDLATDEHGQRRTAYSFRHYYAEERFRELGENPAAFDMIGANMGTGRQQLEAHYIRKGIVRDEAAMVSTVKVRSKRQGVSEESLRASDRVMWEKRKEMNDAAELATRSKKR